MAQVYFHCSNVKAELVECGTAVDDLAEVSDHAWQHFESGAQMMGGHFEGASIRMLSLSLRAEIGFPLLHA